MIKVDFKSNSARFIMELIGADNAHYNTRSTATRDTREYIQKV